MINPNPQGLWLEPVLERHLGQVAAPDELWDSIRNPSPRPAKNSAIDRRLSHRLILTAAALSAAVIWGLLPRHTDMEFRSDTPAEIRAWVKMRTGLDIPLPARPSQAVQLTGACAVKGGALATEVEVTYRVGGRKAALRVSKASLASAGEGKHRFLKCESVGGTRVSSWTMRGQLYTLAYAARGESRDECLLCHSGLEQLTLSN